MRITCDRCGKDQMLNEVHTPERQRVMPIRDLIARMRHDGAVDAPTKVELLTGVQPTGAADRAARGIA
jgi:hypothetical protein